MLVDVHRIYQSMLSRFPFVVVFQENVLMSPMHSMRDPFYVGGVFPLGNFLAVVAWGHSTIAPPPTFLNEIAGFETSPRPYLLKYGAFCHPDDIGQ